jgi:preprotein translocase subunit SecE
MSPVKDFDGKDAGSGNPAEGAQKPKAVKKTAQQPSKARKAETPKKPPKKAEGPSSVAVWWNMFREYLREVSYEMRKVIWPSRKETIGSTVVVLVIVSLAAVYLGLVDAVLSHLVRYLVG